MRALPLLIALAMLSLLVSCSSSSSTPSTPTLNLITVTPTSPSVAAGLTKQFAAMGTYTDGSTKDLTSTATWSSSTVGVATISSAGLATSKTAGSTTITAASGSISGATTLQVTAATLASIAVTPANSTIAPGTFEQFTATGTLTDGSTQNLTSTATWSSGSSTIVSVTATGLGAAVFNPPSGVGASTIITAMSGSVSGNTGVSISAPTLNSIVISDGDLTLAKGTTHQYAALGIYSDGGERDVSNQVTWGSSSTGVATITPTGKGTAVGVGMSTISAALGSMSAPTVTLNVTGPTVTTIVVAPVMHTIAPLTQLPLSAVAIFSDASTQDITSDATWTSSANGIATVDSTNRIGVVTGVSAGPVTIFASLGGVMGSAPMTVSSATLTSIAFRPTSVTMATGSTLELVATGTFTGGPNQPINEVVTWTASPGTVAVVNASGNITGIGPGTATVMASLAGINQTANVTVEGVSSIALSPTSASIPVGAIARLQAVATLADNTTQNINGSAIWTSGTPAVALAGNVSNTRGDIFGLTMGTSLVGALFPPQIASASVTVTGATLVSLAITPANPSIAITDVQGFKLTGTYSDGTTQVLSSQAQWSSSTVQTAIVNKSGVATPVASGTTTITADFGGMTTMTVLTVQ